MKPIYRIMLFLFSLSLYGCVNSASKQEHFVPIMSDKAPVLIKYVFGKPNIYYINKEKEIAKKWHINLKYMFAGCIITPEKSKQRKKIDIANKKSYRFYEKKFGKGWEQRFQEAVNKALQ